MTETIILGLDGATWDVLDPLLEAGELPNIASLRESGYHGTLESTFPPITAPAWLSMATGQNPGKTGVFYFLNRDDPDSFEFETLGSEKFEGQSFWDVLDARGHSVGVFNYPMLYPPYEIDGFMVSGLGSPEDDTITYPETLKSELDEVTGEYQIKVPYADPKYADRPDTLLDDLVRTLEKREAAMEHLLETKDPDVFFGVVSVTDWAQHYFWRYYDETHALFDPGSSSESQEALVNLWKRVDQTVGKIASIAEEQEATLTIVSDHGFGPVNETFHSNEWLEQRGFRVAEEQSLLGRLRTDYFPYLRKVGEPIVAAIPQLNDLAKSVGTSIQGSIGDAVDWERSIAFAPEQNLTCGMIYMLSDRPEDESAVIDALCSLRDAEGNELNISVYRPEDLYHGPCVELAPDILFEIDDFECAIDPRPTLEDDLFSTGPPSAARSGGHRREGIYLFSKSGTTSGSGERASLLDIAPTVLFKHGEPIPEEMDGGVLQDALSDTSRKADRVPLSSLTETSDDRSRSDTDDVKNRLEDLGYI
ncbi:alkaline phosphatase family protein [Halogranum rubrum]|uniref:Type I phosphodiesterase/nucleotide pyrophosphatase n=1 Tax=Halogranum salarium B-1 TaxID=1210908 RepID=J3EU98_9EURY|nr:alkaline phosphatase family protein [Halogranum salarium]EJN57917.1 hypothetical protein HSB1_33340 [Halogranum salarium B-1]